MKRTPLEAWILRRTKIENRDRKDLERYQLEELIKAVHYAAKNSRYYKKRLESYDLDTLNTISDFEKLPFTYPYHIKANSLEFLCVPEKEVKRIVTLNTSGTTGNEKRIYFTESDLEETVDFFQYGMQCLTGSMDRVLVLLPGQAYGSIGYLLKKALGRSGVYCNVYGIMDNPQKVEEVIMSNNISCIVGIPMQILLLSRIKSETFKKYIRKVLLSTDYVPDILVDELNTRFNCKVFNHYGMTEIGYGGGVECEARKGYHLREANIYVEIIDPFKGVRVGDGHYGEVVITTFKSQAMPLIRYRTGDIARFVKQPCACKTFLRTMEKVKGRMTNSLTVKNGRQIHLWELDERLLKWSNIIDYCPTLKKGGILLIEVVVIDQKASEATKEYIVQVVEDYLHGCCQIRVQIKSLDEWPQVTNSMIKRKFIDLRG